MTVSHHPNPKVVVGRLAPSPTGALHLGNARSFLLAWHHVRQAGGKLVLRIEDLHMARVKPGAMEQIFDDLRWLGIDWDEGPQSPDDIKQNPWVQSEQLERYEHQLKQLVLDEKIYPCTCSRKDIAMAQSAPHGHELQYPGTCRDRWKHAEQAKSESGKDPCWRFKIDDPHTAFTDLYHGPQSSNLNTWSGDFVVAQAFNKVSYQLAVCIDDHLHGITHVLRGDDLLDSTHRQLCLYKSLGWSPPTFGHLPLIIGDDGRRLAKRHGDWKISTLKQLGHPKETVLGLIAWTLGMGTSAQQQLSLDELYAQLCEFKFKPEAFQLSPDIAQSFGV